MKAAMSVMALGLAAVSASVAAAPATKGLNGPLGDELYYNYLEANLSQTYAGVNNGDRVTSHLSYGGAGSIFVWDPLYLLARYRYSDFRYTVPGTPPKPTEEEWETVSAGMGARLPLSYATDLFLNGTYEYFTNRTNPALTGDNRKTNEYSGGAVEAGLRSFMSGFAEVNISYRYREVQSDKAVVGTRRNTLKERTATIDLQIPVYEQFNVFVRGEYGVTNPSLRLTTATHPRYEQESFMLGLRCNFRLPH